MSNIHRFPHSGSEPLNTMPGPDPAANAGDALTDPVSGAASQAYLMRELPREHARSHRYGHPLAVLVCDIDRLRLINSGFGRAAGDEVLRTFRRRANRRLRSSDWLARTRDDEFIIVLPETDLTGARIVAERIRKVFADRPIRCSMESFPATVSVGYSAIETIEDLARLGLEDLLGTAQDQLAAAVKGGRNRTCGAVAQRAQGADPPPGSGQLTKVAAPPQLSIVD